jgi:hypothetical protein
MPAAEPDQAGRSQDALAGRYEIGRLLGSGSFGAVYLARDLRTGALVAIKHLQESSPQRLFRFKREFRVLADRPPQPHPLRRAAEGEPPLVPGDGIRRWAEPVRVRPPRRGRDRPR